MRMSCINLVSYLLILTCIFSSCSDSDLFCKEGEGNVTTQQRAVASFSSIESQGSFLVYVFQDTQLDLPTVSVTAQENIIDLIQTQVTGNSLIIRSSECIQTNGSVVVEVYIPSLNKAALLGSGNLILQTPITSNNLELLLSGSGDLRSIESITSPTCKLTLTGSGNMDLNITANTKLTTSVDGSGDSNIKGSAPNANFYVNGSGNINAFDLATEASIAEIIGSGNINLFATDTVQARISGSGNVRVKGGASVSYAITGSGKVEIVD